MNPKQMCTWAVAAALALIPMTSSAQPAPKENDTSAPRSSTAPVMKLVGSWDTTFETAIQGGPFKALMTFTSDGTILSAEPSAYETTGFGSWLPTGSRTAAYTFRSYVGSATGENTGSIKVVGKLRLDPSQDRWRGPFKVEVFDPSGNLVFSDTGTFVADRIGVEPLGD
jgi:hypothetical protein